MAVHVRFDSLHISLPSSAKQQREMKESDVFWRTCTTRANFSCFPFELNAFITYLACAGFETDEHTTAVTFEGKIQEFFLQKPCFRRLCRHC